MKRRCGSTPAWLARTVLRGSCSTAPKLYGHASVLSYVTHLSQQSFYLCVSPWMKVLTVASQLPFSHLCLFFRWFCSRLFKSVLSLSSFSYLNYSTDNYYYYFFFNPCFYKVSTQTTKETEQEFAASQHIEFNWTWHISLQMPGTRLGKVENAATGIRKQQKDETRNA